MPKRVATRTHKHKPRCQREWLQERINTNQDAKESGYEQLTYN